MTISDVNVALDEMLRLGEVHFAYLSSNGRIWPSALCCRGGHLMDRNEPPLHPEEIIDYLRTYSIELNPPTLKASI